MLAVSPLFRVKLYNEVLVNVSRQVAAIRNTGKNTYLFVCVHINPLDLAALSRESQSGLSAQLIFCLLTHANHIAFLHLLGSNVYRSTIHADGFVRHHLTCFCARGSEPHSINDVVQTAFQQLQQVLTSGAFAPRSEFVIAVKLLFHDAVGAANLLLLPQLHAVFGKSSPTLAVLSWCGLQFTF